MKKRQALTLKRKGYDLDLIRRVQNPGPTIYHSNFIEYGDGVATIVSVYDYPKTVQHQMWFRNLLDTQNTITLMKIGTEDKTKLTKIITNNLNANKGILQDKWQNDERKMVAQNELRQNVNDLNDALNGQEVFKRLYTRIVFIAPTLEELNREIHDFKNRMQNYKMKVYAGEMATQMQQFTVPAMDVHKQGLNDLGFPMKSYALAGTYAFNQTFLSDPRGSFLGRTFQNGEIMFDPSYTDDGSRNTAFNLIIGDSGTGKSVYMHQNIDPLFARGDIIWTFDSTRRLVPHFKALDGLILTMDGTHNRINPLHVYATALNDDGTINPIASFTQHIDKFKTFYSTLNPKASDNELALLGSMLTTFYIDEYKMWARHPEEHLDQLKATRNLSSDQYPTLEEFTAYLRAESYKGMDYKPQEQVEIENMIRIFDSLLSNYGQIVNGPSNVPDLKNEQVVLFDTSGIVNYNKRVYSAIYFNVLSLMNAYVAMNGQEQLQRQDRGEFSKETVAEGTAAPRYFWWIQDEADDIFNADNPMGTIFADHMMQQQRKNYMGFFAIFPGLKNVIPDGIKEDSEASRSIDDFFSRFQNMHIFRLPASETRKLQKYVSADDVTGAQLDTINGLKRRQLLLCLKGFQSTFMTSTRITDEEQKLYKGGI